MIAAGRSNPPPYFLHPTSLQPLYPSSPSFSSSSPKVSIQLDTNTRPSQFGATVFTSYGAFNFSYAMIYLPGSGILAAYTDADTGALDASFTQALAVWLWCWFVLTVLYTAAAVRTSWVLLLDLASLALYLLLLACGHMLANPTLITAAAVVAFVIAFLSCESPPFPTER